MSNLIDSLILKKCNRCGAKKLTVNIIGDYVYCDDCVELCIACQEMYCVDDLPDSGMCLKCELGEED